MSTGSGQAVFYHLKDAITMDIPVFTICSLPFFIAITELGLERRQKTKRNEKGGSENEIGNNFFF